MADGPAGPRKPHVRQQIIATEMEATAVAGNMPVQQGDLFDLRFQGSISTSVEIQLRFGDEFLFEQLFIEEVIALGGRIGTMLPNFPPDLELPRKKEPIFIAAASEGELQSASQAGTREKKKMSMADWEALAKSPPVVEKDKTEQVLAGAKGSSKPIPEGSEDDIVISVVPGGGQLSTMEIKRRACPGKATRTSGRPSRRRTRDPSHYGRHAASW